MTAVMDTTRSNRPGAVVWRLPKALCVMVTVASAAVPLLMLYGAIQSPGQPFAWLAFVAITAVMVVNASLARRSCVVDHRQLRAKGRFASRTVELSDVRQVAMGLGSIWVQTHHALDGRGGTVLCLRMIPTSNATLSGYPVGQQAVELIRARAAAAGAELDPPLPRPQRPRSRKPLIFSI
jgi:hypothetical protein